MRTGRATAPAPPKRAGRRRCRDESRGGRRRARVPRGRHLFAHEEVAREVEAERPPPPTAARGRPVRRRARCGAGRRGHVASSSTPSPPGGDRQRRGRSPTPIAGTTLIQRASRSDLIDDSRRGGDRAERDRSPDEPARPAGDGRERDRTERERIVQQRRASCRARRPDRRPRRRCRARPPAAASRSRASPVPGARRGTRPQSPPPRAVYALDLPPVARRSARVSHHPPRRALLRRWRAGRMRLVLFQHKPLFRARLPQLLGGDLHVDRERRADGTEDAESRLAHLGPRAPAEPLRPREQPAPGGSPGRLKPSLSAASADRAPRLRERHVGVVERRDEHLDPNVPRRQREPHPDSVPTPTRPLRHSSVNSHARECLC